MRLRRRWSGCDGDEVGVGAAVAGSVAEDHVDLVGFVGAAWAMRSGNRLRMDMTSLRGSCSAATTQYPTARPWVVRVARAALTRSRRVLVGVVGGQERHLIDQEHHCERMLRRRGVVALFPGQDPGAGLHVGDRACSSMAAMAWGSASYRP